MSNTPPLRRTKKTPPQAEPERIHQPQDGPIQGEPDGLERLPPNSLEAEQGVLGCILLSPSDSVPQCVELFKPGGQVFFDLRHRLIYDKCVAMWDASKPLDLLTIQQALKDDGKLDGIGGITNLVGLPDLVPSAANLEYYAEIVLKKFLLRQLISACSHITQQAVAEPDDVNSVMASAASALDTVAEHGVSEKSIATMKELVPGAMAHIEMIAANAGKVTGLPTGLADLDMLTWGLHPTEMIILAARPSVGKTSLAMNIAEYVALHEQLPVGVFSLEMSAESLMVRMLCSRAQVSNSAIRKGYIGDNGIHALTSASKAFHKAPLYIDDTSSLGILQLRARARRMHKQYGIRLVVIDYLQLMNAPTKRSDNRQQEVSNISSGLKALAKELKIPVLVLAQLGRKMEDRGVNATPKISDLRESGAIEADADVVILLHRPNKEVTNSDGSYQECIPITAIVGKNRNGPTGEVNLTFIRSCTRFEDAAKISADDVEPPQTELL